MLELFFASSIFSFFGVACELIFTAIYNACSTGGKSWKGEVSLLMFPVYWCAYFIFAKVIVNLFLVIGAGMLLQCSVIVVLIYLVEYTAGIIYKHFGQIPWHYNHSFQVFSLRLRFDVQNVVTALYLPFWYFFAWISLHFYQLMQLVIRSCNF